MIKKAEYWIEKLNLKKHPEGGYFRETYRSDLLIEKLALPEGFPGERSISTAIYFLLCNDEFSAFHRIKSDELWHFYYGDSITLHIIEPNGIYSQIKLGNNIDNGELFQVIVKAGCWFGAALNIPQSYSLTGCTLSPGFDFNDFELGERDELIEMYPEHSTIIEKLTF